MQASNQNAIEKVLTELPVISFSTGQTILSTGEKSGRLLFLKKGGVEVLKDSVQIAKVTQLGSVFGELSVLLDQPHAADVRAQEDSEFYIADATLLAKEPIVLGEVARILGRRIIEANRNIVALKRSIQIHRMPTTMDNILEKLEQILVGGDQTLIVSGD